MHEKGGVTPLQQEKSMLTWFKDNVLALILIIVSGIGYYSLALNRITVLEVKVKQQETRSEKTDVIIENNTTALNKIAIIFAKMDGKLETFEFRLHKLEGE